jgi:hypothetical protein
MDCPAPKLCDVAGQLLFNEGFEVERRGSATLLLDESGAQGG